MVIQVAYEMLLSSMETALLTSNYFMKRFERKLKVIAGYRYKLAQVIKTLVTTRNLLLNYDSV